MNELLLLYRDHFAHAGWAWTLLGVLVAIGLYGYGRRARRRALAGLGRPEAIAPLVASVNAEARIVRAVFTLLALAAVCVALLRPQHGGVAKVIPAKGLDIVVAVDYSKSMLVDDVYPSRIERLEAELSHFIDDARARGDRVGVVVFAGEARGLPLTSDMRLLRMYLRAADPRTENPGGTAIGKALNLSLRFLLEARRDASGELPSAEAEEDEGEDEGTDEDAAAAPSPDEADQVIILLTDGEDNASAPIEVATEAARVGVRIYTVGIGSKSGQPVVKFDHRGRPAGWVKDDEGKVVMTRLDEATLREIAKMTGGAYTHVSPDAFGLDAVREQLAELAVAQREDNVEIEREESFPFVVLPAFALLCLALALGDRRRTRREEAQA